ncbi:hypothetical protein L7F22_003310 [Adiantum nelumboides]|nr:hypothetical protein [Adiantum nelumboides]
MYKVKHNSDGNVSRYKVKLVAKGYAQTYGIDYEETFALVDKMATVRAVIAMVGAKGWILHQMDVKNAFLHGDLQEEVYMEQTQGFQVTDHPDYVYKLQKALYGLKQAPRAWHDKIAQYLIIIGFHMEDVDHSLYVQKTETGIVIITIYVNDLIIGGDALKDVEHVKVLLCKQFDMKDLGDLRYFLEIGLVSQFMQLPRKPHLDAVRCILRYVRATLDYALFYDIGTQVQVDGYIDSD